MRRSRKTAATRAAVGAVLAALRAAHPDYPSPEQLELPRLLDALVE
ncbi:hypothetical protein KBX37_20465 [Micromonospora sp. U56]|nr:hypothetical protein [Micromonospora sp. U56]MBQ0895446.1 hypothetical protein [Micromonospora sp. U56]